MRKNKSKENLPLVSVIMPVYNEEKYISDAINSVLNQTYKNWELIIINDFSKDKTLKIIKDFIKKDKRVKLINIRKNRGPSICRNLGIKKAKGEYITFLDGDDMLKEKRLEEQSNFMQRRKIDVSYCDMLDIKENGLKVVFKGPNPNRFYKNLLKKSKTKFDIEILPGHHIGKTIRGTRTIFGAQLMIKSKSLKENKIYFDETFTHMEDMDLLFQCIGKKLKIKRFPKIGYIYKRHKNQISKEDKKIKDAAKKINKKLIKGDYFYS
jgi:glycosyltransferase involved in cell wall biosynthesis